ncbi:MAG: universal stress protein [Desulfuromonas sp.]|nr:MAG: universal stress protein [Desulfuromonas sp.]
MAAKVLVPINGSDLSQAVIDAIIANRERFPVNLTLLHVINTHKLAYRMIPDFQLEMIQQRAEQAGNALLAEAQEKLVMAGISTVSRLETGDPRELIGTIANEETFDLLIIGRHGIGEIRDVLFGDVANHVLHKVTIPVLLI